MDDFIEILEALFFLLTAIMVVYLVRNYLFTFAVLKNPQKYGSNPIPTLTLVLLFIGILSFIILMLLPSLVELKKPRDPGPGPRMIEYYGYALPLHDLESKIDFMKNEGYTETLEAEHRVLRGIAAILAVLPNLES